MVTASLETDSKYLSKYASFSCTGWASSSLSPHTHVDTLRSSSDRKATTFYLLRDHMFRFPTSWSLNYMVSRERSMAIFDPANSGLPLLLPPLKVGEREYFSIFTWNLEEILPFHAIFSDSAVNMQQSTMKSGKIRQLGKRGNKLWVYITNQLKQ